LTISQDNLYKKDSFSNFVQILAQDLHMLVPTTYPMNQLKIMYRFCRNTDLGISHFNFSSKNQSSKVYTCFGKVVVLVTQSATKLGLQFLDFSMILYNFSKLQLKHTKGVRFISRTDPWKVLGVHSYAPGSQLHPRKDFRASNVVQGHGAARPAGFWRPRRRPWQGK
jgi:hypothetical protein